MFANCPVESSSCLLKVAAISCQAETAAGCVAAKRITPSSAIFSAIYSTPSAPSPAAAPPSVEQADHAGGASKKTKHYKRWEYYLVRECQLDGSIKVHFIRTCDQVADCLTKVLDKRSSSCASI
eukprot:6213111-Pleurochrysis_carterae.AAC.1